MAKIIILGSANAVNDSQHDYTHFLLIGDSGEPVLVDAGSNPLGKMKKLGVEDDKLKHVILTHFHPDHITGFPNMLQHMNLLGRTAPMTIYGLHHCINRIEGTLEMFGWDEWQPMFPVTFVRVGERDNVFLFENDDFIIHTYPVQHFVPTIGIRVQNKHRGTVFGYGCDTQPCDNVLNIARDVDLLIHEAAGPPPGHSTARQAGEIATQANAKKLCLIHYQVWNADPSLLIDEARETYAGPVHLCNDFDVLEF
jgi:ribonuclease Z